MDPRAVARVLTEIAEAASETLELQEVFDRVATAVREVIPCEHMGVVRILEGDIVVVHATTVRIEGLAVKCFDPQPLLAFSPRLRPSPERLPRVDDATTELDPSFPMDAAVVEQGVRSSLWEPFRLRGAFTGGVWLSSAKPGAFREAHREVLSPIAAILGSAVEHWRIWDAERRRRERLDRLEEPLRCLAESLDVRQVFAQVSEAMQPILPHDVLALTELDAGLRTFRITALAGPVEVPAPSEPIRLTEDESQSRLLDFDLVHDATSANLPDTERNRVLNDAGVRSWLRVPVRLWGEVRGSIAFLSLQPGRFREEDVEVASRLADRVALALSHQRLAEEARIAAEERERAERLEATVAALSRQLEGRSKTRVVGASRGWQEVMRRVARVAASETTVLVTGESGTGKEVVSRLLHQGSPRAGRPLVAINCAALPDELLESELFGHEKGAFTGAVATHVGRLEQAAGGTLFLDEIGEMSPLVQAKLLRVLEEREFQRVGGVKTLKADVRLVTATHRDLAAAMARGSFREDLYYRLNVFEIAVPPLRERPDDILPLAEAFLEELGEQMGRAAGISRDAGDWLLAYPWPGNVRELRNAIERAILLCDGGLITREHLPAPVARPASARNGGGNGLQLEGPLPPGGLDLDDVERSLVERALEQARGNKSKAAKLLGLTRAQLYSRLEKHSLR